MIINYKYTLGSTCKIGIKGDIVKGTKASVAVDAIMDNCGISPMFVIDEITMGFSLCMDWIAR